MVIFTQIFALISSLTFYFILASNIEKNQFGQFNYFVNIITIFAIIGFSGFSQLLLRNIVRVNISPNKKLFQIILQGYIFGTLLVIIFVFSVWLYKDSLFMNVTPIFVVFGTLIIGLRIINVEILKAFNHSSQSILTNGTISNVIIAALFSLPFITEMLHNIDILCLYLGIIFIVQLLMFLWLFRTRSQSAGQGALISSNLFDLRKLLHITISKFSTLGVEKLDLIIIASVVPFGIVAEYSIMSKIVGTIALLLVIQNTLLPASIGPLLQQNSYDVVSDLVRSWITVLTIGAVCCSLILILCCFTLLEIIFGNDPELTYNVLFILISLQISNIVFGPNSLLLALLNETKIMLYVSLVNLSLTLVLMFLASWLQFTFTIVIFLLTCINVTKQILLAAVVYKKTSILLLPHFFVKKSFITCWKMVTA